MTAINVLIGYGEAHLFADTGHYDPVTKRLDHLAPKVFPLPQKALLAWSGPSAIGQIVADLCHKSEWRDAKSLAAALPGMIADLHILQPFSAILVGPGFGVAVEEGGKVNHLSAGSVVRSISATSQLDPSDIKASGVKLMEEQRQSSGVVFGECQYWHINRAVCTMQVLHDWQDQPAKVVAASTLAAKIQNLTVDRINFAPNAVTSLQIDSVSGTGAEIEVDSDGSFPNILDAKFVLNYSGVGSSSYANTQCRIMCQPAGGSTFTFRSRTRGWSGYGPFTSTVLVSGVDSGVVGTRTYWCATSTSGGGGGGSGYNVTVVSTRIRSASPVK